MNKVFLIGRLTRNVEFKQSQAADVARTGIAVDRRFSKNNDVDFFNLVAFGKTAEFLNKYFAKGSRIAVEGRLHFNQYEDNQGVKRSAVDVIVEQIDFADSKKKAADNNFDGSDPDNG